MKAMGILEFVVPVGDSSPGCVGGNLPGCVWAQEILPHCERTLSPVLLSLASKNDPRQELVSCLAGQFLSLSCES
jgi:hypothetical protein